MRRNNYQGALQTAIGSGFGPKTTADEILSGIDLSGKVAIVTGGNTGIGLETTKTLASAGATVIVPARDISKARKNLEGMQGVEIEAMDLMAPDSIDNFARKFLSTARPLHMLIHNAGIMWVPLRKDGRGIESQLATNYLAQFQLTARLWPALKAAAGSRVVCVSSQGHQFAPFDFGDPNFEFRPYETLSGYGQSKTACNLFAMEFDARAKAYGIQAFSVQPGAIGGTELGREAPLELLVKMGLCDARGNILPEIQASLKTIPQGAATTVWCATSAQLEGLGGVYCEDCDVARLAQETSFGPGVRPYSLDKDNAQRLWDWSEKITGIRFVVD